MAVDGADASDLDRAVRRSGGGGQQRTPDQNGREERAEDASEDHAHPRAVRQRIRHEHPCYESLPKNRVRFAHTAPVHVEVPGKPLRPRPAEIDFLIRRVEDQIARGKDILPAAALDEYREALRVYQAVKTAAAGEK